MHDYEVSNQSTNHSQNAVQAVTNPQLPSEYKLSFRPPFSTFTEDRAAISYVVDGLLKQGAFSVWGAKPKNGKSSISRHLAVSVSKGTQWLGRSTRKGEVILVSLEDPDDHVDDCLRVLNYDPATDSPIHIVENLPPKISERFEGLREMLTERPDVRLIVVDTLSKFLRVSDLNDYSEVQTAIQQLRDLARQFPQVHIMAITHCKKVQTDNPFDSILGSTAIRGETDTTVALYQEGGQRLIAAEVRRGRKIDPTILHAEIIHSSIDGAEVVRDFSLGEPFDAWKSNKDEKSRAKRKAGFVEKVIEFLRSQEGHSASQESILENVEGRDVSILAAIKLLKENGIIAQGGIKRSPKDPLRFTLNPDPQGVNEFISKFSGWT